MTNQTLSEPLQRIADARHHDPFEVLGRHPVGKGKVMVRAFMPYAEEVQILESRGEGDPRMERVTGTDFFQWVGPEEKLPHDYHLFWRDKEGGEHFARDPYCFEPQIETFDLHLFGEGKHRHIQNFLGARVHMVGKVKGVLFSVWAPNAQRVSVIGDFNNWDGRCHPMRVRPGSGVWELFVPDLNHGHMYKFEIRDPAGTIHLKSDPVSRQNQLRPETASVITAPDTYGWGDTAWMEQRKQWDWQKAPISIYELHLGSWRRGWEGEFLNYREIARQLVEYMQEMGFTHVELMPITEHPYDLSWGYQTTGYFAPTSRFGSEEDFRYFIDYLHQHSIGVILDWVPAHFPKDAHGLARFDGTPLYEHADPRLGEHLDWNTYIFNYGRHEVHSFLLSSALYWLEAYHIDGLRVDAVASMLYLDYSREEWVPNQFGGRENLEAMDFLRHLNHVVGVECPGALMIAEESTSWPQVTQSPESGGLGFHMKWNMGWMNDTLAYIEREPIHRQYHHNDLTFSLYYAFTENFLLPFSHDEVVHGKGSMLQKMPGDEWQRFANLRTLYMLQWTHPGKKLLFMGTEIGQGIEWNSAQVMEWHLLEYGYHQGVQKLVKDLNGLYSSLPALHQVDFEWEGFQWIDCEDHEKSVISFVRQGATGEGHVVVVLNFTPVVHNGYRLGVPSDQNYREIFNSDAACYGGSNVGNRGLSLQAEDTPWMNQQHSVVVEVPPLGGVILQVEPAKKKPAAKKQVTTKKS
uniref:1,4-alpha-glucan branching enzyme GlgB n=1 Tax=Magnetococcus massalia (strain MO-1) TaxID=451514 RepID=A0A1S7LGN2_MAGMO|nr:GH13 : 1,4-alpha-glucan branching enzyme [Candidatus Magnetococcus massalia]